MDRWMLRFDRTVWSRSLVYVAVAVFLIAFGEGMLNGVRTNFFVGAMGLTGEQVLWLEGIREIPGLALMGIAALIMHVPLAHRAAGSVLLMGVGYGLLSVAGSFGAVVAMESVASIGVHNWMPLNSTLALCLAPPQRTGQVQGNLSAVAALAGIVGMGAIALTSAVFRDLPLPAYYVVGGSLIALAAVALSRLPRSVGQTAVAQPRLLLQRRYWLYYVLTLLEGSRKQVLGTFGSLVLVQSYGFEVWQVSLVLLASAVTNAVAAPHIGRLIDRYGERTALSVSYVCLVACCAAYAVVRSPLILAGVLVIIKMLTLVGMGLNTYLHRVAPEEALTPTLSAGISINHITSVIMPLVAGAVLPRVGYGGIFLGAGALIAISVPFALALSGARPAAAAVAAPAD